MVVRGELDVATVPEFQAVLDALHDSGVVHVVVDLSEVDFIDSTALHAFVRLDASARRDGFNASFVRGSPKIQQLFDVVGLADHFVFVDAADDLNPPA